MIDLVSGGRAIAAGLSGSDVTSNLDPNLLALVSVRNIGHLATIKSNGRTQVSSVDFTLDPATALTRMSMIGNRVIARNLRRDPRASIFVDSPKGWPYALLEGTVELSPVALAPNDEVAEELVEIFRATRGTDHPDWEDYRAAMVADHYLVASLHVERAYGLSGPSSVPSV